MPMNPLSILLIEDDPDDIELMHVALKNLDIQYSLEAINQGDKVLPYLEVCKKFPSVIVLDLNLPKLHGRDILKFIKGSDRFKKIPVAILTTASSQKEKEFCITAGADEFLTKPSTVEGFNKTVYAIMNVASRNVMNEPN
jgi:CheY-like chemotaxis protein